MEIDNECRKLVIKTLSDILDSKLAKQIEKSIYNFTENNIDSDTPSFLFQSIYESKSNDIINEINNKNSDYLLKAIKSKPPTININEIAFLKPEELNPDKYENIIKRKEMEEYRKNNKVGSSAFTCVKCKKSNCSVTTRQTRAGDEPPTIFVECLECNNIFKYN